MNQNGDANDERLLKERSLAFFGAITASVSHELNNVVSIIDQTAGLLDDLLYGAREGRPIDNERLQRIVDGITQQTSRGVKIIGRFNSFAHTVDYPVQAYELNVTLSNLAGLCERFAAMKRVTLETHLADGEIQLSGSPFMAQQVLFAYLRRMFAVAVKDDTIVISSKPGETSVEVAVSGPSGEPEGGFDREYVDLLVGRLGGSIVERSDGERMIVELAIPRA